MYMSQTLNNSGIDCQMFVKFGMNIIPLEIKQIDTQKIFMFVPCINSIKALFYYSKMIHTIIKS